MLKSVWLKGLIIDTLKRENSLLSLAYKRVASLLNNEESYLCLFEPSTNKNIYFNIKPGKCKQEEKLPFEINFSTVKNIVQNKVYVYENNYLYLPLFLEKSLCFGFLCCFLDSKPKKITSILNATKTFSFTLYNECLSTIIDSTHNTIISTKDLCVDYINGKTINKALIDINLDIKENEFTVIIGNSGSGKSTLLNALGGMLRPTSGDVFYNNLNISKMNDNSRSDYRRDIVGFVFQQYNLISDLTVKENIELASSLVEDSYSVEEVLKMVRLEDKINSFQNEMSGGEQQRVCIARALVKKPKILLCDEPTGALDSENAKIVITILKDIALNQGIPVVVITHNLSLVSLAERCITIKNGKIEDDIYQPFALTADYLD